MTATLAEIVYERWVEQLAELYCSPQRLLTELDGRLVTLYEGDIAYHIDSTTGQPVRCTYSEYSALAKAGPRS